MKKTIILLMLFVGFISQAQTAVSSRNVDSHRNAKTLKSKIEINTLLDNWHQAAADANEIDYFDAMSDDAIYIGTDATENWTKAEFQAYANPHFKRGKAWRFKVISRNVYIDKKTNYAWFDELLNTQMKICRGSGILRRENGKWKIVHYVLSMTVPNDNTNEVVKIKSPIEDAYLESHTK